MATVAVMEFKRGDYTDDVTVCIPAASWSPGGELWFAAKPAVDDDDTDSHAVINKLFTDADLLADQVISGVTYKTYQIIVGASDITQVSFADGTTRRIYSGEFEFVPSGGPPYKPDSFPDDDNYIKVIIYADIKRGVS